MSVHIQLIAVGKNKDKHLQALIDDYLKRLTWKFTLTEIVPPNVSDAERKSKEAELIRAVLPPKAVTVILDERGDNPDSVAFAKKLEQFFLNQASHIVFIIGGADGIDESLRREANWVISFGKLTWPHMLVRLLLVEQLYRAGTILSGHPYHRV